MDVTSTPQIDAMAAGMNNGDVMAAVMLKKAMTQQTQAVMQLLQAMPQAPQQEGLGQLIDVML